MKRPVLIIVIIIGILTSLYQSNDHLKHLVYDFDPDTEAVVDVCCVTDYYNRDDNAPPDKFYTCALPIIPQFLRADEIEAFSPDAMSAYTVYGIELQMDKTTGKERLIAEKELRLLDENDNEVPLTPELSDVIDAMLTLEPHLYDYWIYEVNGEYFPYVEANVNWFSPCELYYYDKAQHKLKTIVQLDNERIVGLRIRNLDLLRK